MEADRRIALALLHARNMDFCREHIDNAIASLPPEWISGWAYREPVPVEADDVPF